MKSGQLGLRVAQAALVFLVVCAATRLYQSIDSRHAKSPFMVKAVAHEWWWEFDYPASGIRTRNELHVPISNDLEIELLSADVLHSFWMQGMDQPVDVIPGKIRKLRLRINSTGELDGNCDSGCGCGQVCMHFRVLVENASDFARWMALRHLKPATLAAKGFIAAPACALDKAMPTTGGLAAAHLRNILSN